MCVANGQEFSQSSGGSKAPSYLYGGDRSNLAQLVAPSTSENFHDFNDSGNPRAAQAGPNGLLPSIVGSPATPARRWDPLSKEGYVAVAGLGLESAGGTYGALAQLAAGNANADYYKFLSDQNTNNAELVKQEADVSAIQINQTASNQAVAAKKQADQSNASLVAQSAANGVDAGSVTTQNLMKSNLSAEEYDQAGILYNAQQKVNAVKTNAAIQDINYRGQATVNKMQETNARNAGITNAIGSLLGTAASVTGSYFKGQKAGLFESTDIPLTGENSTTPGKNQNFIFPPTSTYGSPRGSKAY